MRILLSILGLALPSTVLAQSGDGAAGAQERRAYEILDYYRSAGVSGPVLSPDGARVAFTVRRYDVAADESWTELWMMAADGSAQRRMSSDRSSSSSPAFSPDGKRLLFVRDGQLRTMPVDGGESRALTDFAPGVSDPVWSPDGRWIAVTATVHPECGADARCNAERDEALERNKLDVHVADSLLYRHWDGWRDGKVMHVLLVDAESGRVVRDLTPGPWESPTFALGGGRGYAFSPDSRELCFVSNRDEDQAESTNADLWVV